MTDTIFQKIINKEIPASIVYEDDQCLAFNDIQPQAPTHILIIPKKSIDKLSSAQDEDRALLGHLLLTANRIAEDRKLDAFRIIINNGAKAGQTVFHLHVHLMSGRLMQWPPG